MSEANTTCLNIQRSLGWCQGTPELPGIMRRLYFITKSAIVAWPSLKRDANGVRCVSAEYEGDFTLAADEKWRYIDILPDKSQLTSEPQGELPSQTQLNKLSAVHPGVGVEASSAAAYLNNSDNVFLAQDMRGKWRVIGSERWLTKTTVSQDNGQGATGATSTTIAVEATDEVPSPFYNGVIETEDGDLQTAPSTGEGDGDNT